MLEYGFVVVSDDRELSYDHIKKRHFPISRIKMRELKSHRCNVLATQDFSKIAKRVETPLFRYEEEEFCPEKIQSAFYALDTMTRKNIIPVFLPETQQVKDLGSVLTEAEKKAFLNIVFHLRTAYLHPETRHPSEFFLKQKPNKFLADEMALSDDEFTQLFGRLPNISTSEAIADQSRYIPENFSKLA